jgi:hypothetical protein
VSVVNVRPGKLAEPVKAPTVPLVVT